MRIMWSPALLILSQVILAGAFPTPRFFGPFWFPHPHAEHAAQHPRPFHILTFFFPGNAQTVSSTDTSVAPSSSFDSTTSSVPPSSSTVPDVTSSQSGQCLACPRLFLSDGHLDSSSDSNFSSYSSEITFADPNLSIQTVTITSLPSSQVPTVTSASQSFPDTTGVGFPVLPTVEFTNCNSL